MRRERRSGTARRSGLRPVTGPAVYRLLVYDRDAGTRRHLAGVLADEGFRVVAQTADPGRVVTLSRDLRPDVLVMGVALGAGDVAALAQITRHRWAAVVVVVADCTGELIAAVRDAGALGYLSAPPGREALVAAVELAFARGAEMTELAAAAESVGRKLRGREDIDQAKTVLMTRYGMSEPEAHRWIQRAAMQRRETSAAVAGQITTDGPGPRLLSWGDRPPDPGRFGDDDDSRRPDQDGHAPGGTARAPTQGRRVGRRIGG